MIMAEENTRERFLNRNNRENNRDSSDRKIFSNIGHPDMKHGRDNTITMADKTKKFQNSGDLKALRICIVYGTRKETTQQEIAESSLIGT
jgi:soluble cytochrome b562